MDKIYCAACGHLVTRTDWRRAVNSAHDHTLFNPARTVFPVLCFRETPDTEASGDATADFSWFDGYVWRIAFCSDCAAHLGWRFEGTDVFLGLVKPKLMMINPI